MAGIGIILSENEAADTIAENGGGCDTVLTLALAPATRQIGHGVRLWVPINGVVGARPGEGKVVASQRESGS